MTTDKDERYQRQGEDHGSAKLTEDLVRQLRGMARRGCRQEEMLALCEQRGVAVTFSAISQAATGATWSHLPGAVAPRKRKAREFDPRTMPFNRAGLHDTSSRAKPRRRGRRG